jgi:hypothetical protein
VSGDRITVSTPPSTFSPFGLGRDLESGWARAACRDVCGLYFDFRADAEKLERGLARIYQQSQEIVGEGFGDDPADWEARRVGDRVFGMIVALRDFLREDA